MDITDRQQLREEKKRVAAYHRTIREQLDKAEKVTIKFMSAEIPPLPEVLMSYEGAKTYRFVHNGIYEVPVPVAERLQYGCRIPIYEEYGEAEVQSGPLRADPIDPSERIVGYAPRFIIVPIDAAGQHAGETEPEPSKEQTLEKPAKDKK